MLGAERRYRMPLFMDMHSIDGGVAIRTGLELDRDHCDPHALQGLRAASAALSRLQGASIHARPTSRLGQQTGSKRLKRLRSTMRVVYG